MKPKTILSEADPHTYQIRSVGDRNGDQVTVRIFMASDGSRWYITENVQRADGRWTVLQWEELHRQLYRLPDGRELLLPEHCKNLHETFQLAGGKVVIAVRMGFGR